MATAAQAADTVQIPWDWASVKAERARRHLRVFVEQAWPIVEPGTPFVPNWHIDCICAHLQALPSGQLLDAEGKPTRNLLVNVPPRTSKSLLISVMWPAWLWINQPELRFLTASYAQDLATRDSLKSRRILESPWYQSNWGDVVTLTGDQNAKMRYENTRTGHRIATSVGGLGTGEGGSVLVCFAGETPVWTDRGILPIEQIVNGRLPVTVPSYDPDTGVTRRQPVTGWHRNPGRRLLEIGLPDGQLLRCTPDHRLLTQRGWVTADQLRMSDRLVGAARPGMSVTRESESIGNRPPATTGANVLDRRSGNAIAHRQYGRSRPASCDGTGVVSGQFGSWAHLQDGECPVNLGISDVLSASAIGQIGEHGIAGVPIQMTDFLPRRNWPHKRQHHYLMNEQVPRLPVHSGIETGITLTVPSLVSERRSEQSSWNSQWSPTPKYLSRITVDPSQSGDAVQSIQSRYISPLFIRQGDWVDHTYCLTVAHSHTFFVGQRYGIVVANCDDGHNVTQGESEAEREAVVRWWDESMSTRGNDPKTTCRVIVMQRVHEQDLAGHMLEQGTYHHLCLPARYEPRVYVNGAAGLIQPHDDCPLFPDPRKEPGELLWPARFPAEIQDSIERSLGSSYAIAGQMQQRPVPREGALFKSEDLRPIPEGAARRPIKAVLQFYDLAFSEKDSADYTAGVTLGIPEGDGSGSDEHYILHAWHERVDESRLDLALVDQIISRSPDLVGIELGAFKQAATQDLVNRVQRMLAARRCTTAIIGVPVTTDKVFRAQLPAARARAGLLYVDRKAPWFPAFEAELLSFPKGANDDWVDCLSGVTALAISQPIAPIATNIPIAESDSTLRPKTGLALYGGSSLLKSHRATKRAALRVQVQALEA